jgi:hypothetical protein
VHEANDDVWHWDDLLHPCRRGENGELLHSTCCNNTASEHRMFERFMVDDLRHWATTYKVGGWGEGVDAGWGGERLGWLVGGWVGGKKVERTPSLWGKTASTGPWGMPVHFALLYMSLPGAVRQKEWGK